MSFFTNNKTGELYFVTGYGVDHTNTRAGSTVVAYYPCNNPTALCFRELTEFKEKFTPVQADQAPVANLKDLSYPLRLCVELMQFVGITGDVAKEMHYFEIVEHLSDVFTEECINEAKRILSGRSSNT